MNKQGVIGVVVGVLLLSGCAGTTEVADVAETTPSASAEATAEPLVASTPTAEAPSGDDASYLAEARLRLKTIPDATDEQLLAAAETSCGLYTQGQDKFTQQLIEGEQPDPATGFFTDSLVIATWAAKTYCPEFDD